MQQHGGQFGERSRVIGTQPRGPLVAGHRLIVLAEVPQRAAEIQPRLVQFGPKPDGPLIAFDSLVVFAQYRQGVAQMA